MATCGAVPARARARLPAAVISSSCAAVATDGLLQDRKPKLSELAGRRGVLHKSPFLPAGPSRKTVAHPVVIQTLTRTCADQTAVHARPSHRGDRAGVDARVCREAHCRAGVVLWFDADGEMSNLYAHDLP